MALPADRAPIVKRLKLEAALARCENELYAAQRRIAELEQRLRKAAQRRKLRKKQG